MKQGDRTKKGEKILNKGQKPYVKPQLKEYGHIEKLTQTGGSRTLEGFVRKRP